ncbi:MAG: hypothetical protein WC415_03500 [Patescibacteria group bacterium]|jgi:hypothetical protein
MENNFENKKESDSVILKEEKAKHIALWSGLIFFFGLIFCLWLVNVKNIFSIWPSNEEKKFNLETFSQEFKSSLKEVSGRMDNFELTTTSAAIKSNNEKYEKGQKEPFEKQ